MKKTIFTITCLAMLMTLSQSCSSSKSTLVADVENVAKQESKQLIVTYLTQKLAGGHPTLSSVLSSSNASTPLTSILGSNGSNTSTLTDLVSSQFGVNQQMVTNNVTSNGSTLGSLASFLVENTSASTLTNLISKVK